MRAPIYIQECLEKRLLPLIKSHSIPTLFWPDLASIHYPKMTLDWFKNNNILFVPVDCSAPNCLQHRPIEIYWTEVKEILRKGGKEAKNALSFQKYWEAAARCVDESTVKRLMRGLGSKVNKFSRLPITDQLKCAVDAY